MLNSSYDDRTKEISFQTIRLPVIVFQPKKILPVNKQTNLKYFFFQSTNEMKKQRNKNKRGFEFSNISKPKKEKQRKYSV